jgi:methyltransferase (TIGR00027 family)
MSARQLLEDVTDTARWVAHYRALESERPDALFRDPFARRLAGERGKQIAESLPTLSLDWVIPVRTRVFDELIMEAERTRSIETVLNLAAGLDTRPYRLNLRAGLRWIEVDLPSIVRMKREALASETANCILERLPLDLTDAAQREAFFSGLSATAGPTLVITEGVLSYLDEASVAALSRELHALRNVTHWIVEAPMPEVLERARRGWGKTLGRAGAEMKFAPAAGLDFFAAFGWVPELTRSLTVEAQRLGREMKFAKLARFASTLTARGRDRWHKISMYAVLRKRSPADEVSRARGASATQRT